MNRSRRRAPRTNHLAVFVIGAVVLLFVATVVSDTTTNLVGMANALSSVSTTTPTRWVVVDFDGTCTVRDTTPLLPRLACLVHSHRQQQQQDTDGGFKTIRELASADLPDRLKRFTELENDYFQRYRRVLESPQHDHLEGHLDRLDAISTEITDLVTESGVLKGLGSVSHTELLETIERHIEEHGDGCFLFEESLRKSLSLHPGCLSVLQTYCSLSSQQESSSSSPASYRMGVLSINWCPALIRAVLVHPLRRQSNATQQQDDNDDDDHVPVWSNSVDHHGAVSLPIPGAIAKKKYIQDLQQQQQQQEMNKVIYVGDSSTDLLALIQADVGILFGRSESTMGVALKFGILLRPLSEYHDTSTTSSDNPIVWTTSDWDEIGAFLDRY